MKARLHQSRKERLVKLKEDRRQTPTWKMEYAKELAAAEVV